MAYKPNIQVGGTYDNELGGTRTIGNKFVTWFGLVQYRVTAGDKAWWHGDGTPNISQDGALIAPSVVQPPQPPVPVPTPTLGKILIEVDVATRTARVL